MQVNSLQSSLDVALGRIAELESVHRSSSTSKVFREGALPKTHLEYSCPFAEISTILIERPHSKFIWRDHGKDHPFLEQTSGNRGTVMSALTSTRSGPTLRRRRRPAGRRRRRRAAPVPSTPPRRRSSSTTDTPKGEGQYQIKGIPFHLATVTSLWR